MQIETFSAPNSGQSSGEQSSVNSAGAVHENQNDSSVWSSGKDKKKQGLFAKLLDGLTGKSSKTINGNNGENQNDSVVKISLKKGETIQKDVLNQTLIPFESNEQSDAELIIASLNLMSAMEKKPEIPVNVNHLQADSEAVTETGPQINHLLNENLNNNDENQILSEISQQMNQDDSVSSLLSAAANIPHDKSGVNPQNSSVTEDQSAIINPHVINPQNQEADNGDFASEKSPGKKPGKGIVDIFPARHPENRFYQFTGEPKQGLVDILAKADDRQENSKNIDTRGKRGRERAVLEVRDLRTGENRPNSLSESMISGNSSVFRSEKADVDIPVELSRGINQENTGKAFDGSARLTGFDDALAQKLNEGLNSDIVRQASVILRNGGEGTIQLSLKPETLGNVKIRLEMTENKITGHIIVESSEAFRAFERELPVLEKAFRDSGFSETNLDMFFNQDHGFGQRQNRDFSEGIIPMVLQASGYESETTRASINENTSSGLEQNSVNILI